MAEGKPCTSYGAHVSVRSSFVAFVADFSNGGGSKMEKGVVFLPLNILIAFSH